MTRKIINFEERLGAILDRWYANHAASAKKLEAQGLNNTFDEAVGAAYRAGFHDGLDANGDEDEEATS